MSRHALLGVSGSIAAYKAVELVRLMKRERWSVSVVMTEAATRFVGPLTFRTLSGNPVVCDLFDSPPSWDPVHISLAERAAVFAVAPCTANVAAKLANGLADDMLSCTALAVTCPVVIAPAMNENMWAHPATVRNLGILRDRGVHVIDAETGDLACGSKGTGRMAAPDTIMARLRKVLGQGMDGSEHE